MMRHCFVVVDRDGGHGLEIANDCNRRLPISMHSRNVCPADRPTDRPERSKNEGHSQKTYLRVSARAKSVEIELSVSRNGYPTFFSTNPHDYMGYPEERDKKA